MKTWFEIVPPKAGAKTTKVMLYDGIGDFGVSANDFAAAFDAIKTPQIELHVNSYGGEIVAGFACYNAIKKHSERVTAHIDGIAASIASVIAVAAGKVRIAKNAFVMIHNGSATIRGDSGEMRKAADVLEKLCVPIAQAYADKSGKPVEKFKAAMDAETWMNAKEAIEWGLADEIEGKGDETKMAAAAMRAVAEYQKAPPALRQFAARLASRDSEVPQRKEAKMDKLVSREGKWFLGEVEVDVADCLASVKPVAKVDEAETQKAVAKARDEGVKAERDYRALFSGIVASAKLDAPAAVEFEKQFYGRAEADLKFLASHAIGQRAQAVGESAPGNGEGQGLSAEAKLEKDTADAAAKRFAAEASVRLLFGVNQSQGAETEAYKAALNRYVAREQAWAKDQAKHGTTVASAR